MTSLPRPPYDAELEPVVTMITEQATPLTTDSIVAGRDSSWAPPIQTVLEGHDIIVEDRVIPGPDGGPDLTVSIFRRGDHRAGGPGIYNIHGGGMIMGTRFDGADLLIDWVEALDAVAVSVEYRLAPENPDPAPVTDCYAGLAWMAEHADELGFDVSKLVIVGGSAGGGLAAGTTLMARDLRGPQLAASVLIYPMIDDRNDTVSSQQFDGIGNWDRASNDVGWDSLLGTRRKGDDVSIYAAPARATVLSNLPPTFIDVGSAEVFRDEDVAYASRIWASGGVCELHVWPGAFHGSDLIAPQAAQSRLRNELRLGWVKRTLKLPVAE